MRASNSNGVIDATHGQDAYGATRPVYQVYTARQDVLDTMFVDGVSMASTDFHEFEVLTFAESRNLCRDATGQSRIAVFIYKFHLICSFRIVSCPRRSVCTISSRA